MPACFIFSFLCFNLIIMNQEMKVGVVGAGTMGAGIAQVAAASGHHVYLTDANASMLNRSMAEHKKTMDKLIEKGKLTSETADQLMSRIHYTESISSFSDAGLVIEAIVENLEVKQKLFRELESVVGGKCILATNTSSLSIASVAAACNNRGRIMGIHFFNPAPLMPLVEIIPALTSDPLPVKAIKKLIEGWGKIVVLAKDTPGFIVNRIARPYYGEAIRIYEEGIADFATIDWALKQQGNFKMGPFELMDFIGNDINYKVTETVWQQLFYDPRYKPSLTQKRLYEAQYFGKKSGRGYYNYQTGTEIPLPLKNDVLAKNIFMRVLAMLINEAADALYLQVASRDDIDLAMTKGVNYPKGLLAWCDEIGSAEILKVLENLQSTYMEERYRPSVLLRQKAKDNSRFY
jgi:3-hydroxybutyryl-CoA dehydrogenase